MKWITVALMTLAVSVGTLGGQVPSGEIRGVVRDPAGEPLPGATVLLNQNDQTLQETWTDVQGNFVFANVAPGTYRVKASLTGLGEAEAEVRVGAGSPAQVTLALQGAQFQEEVVVQAERPTTGVERLLEERRQSPLVSEGLSQEDMGKTPDADAASAMQRVTGVTTVANRYVYVRGLGERYSTVLLNGTELPSSETEKRLVPLDLFPTRLLEQVTILKSYAPDLPGSFGGGLVNLSTLEWPQNTVFSLRVGSGANSQVNGGAFPRYAGGLNFSGIGGQPLPPNFPRNFITRASRFNPSGLSPEQLQTLGRSLAGSWRGQPQGSAPPNRSFGLSFGRSFGPVGIVVSATQSHNFTKSVEEQRFFGLDGGRMVPINDYDLVTFGEQVRWGLFGSLAWKLHPQHSLRFTSLASRLARNSDRTQEGYNSNSGNFIRDLRARHTREDLVTHQLVGEHFLPGVGQGLAVEWKLAKGQAANRGDLRENLYGLGGDGVFRLLVGYPEVGKMEFYRLDDRITDASLTTTSYFSVSTNTYAAVKAGANFLRREREFLARRFKFVTSNPNQFDLSLPPELLFQPSHIRPDGFELREVTGINDAYTGEQRLDAGFAQADFTHGRFRALLGLRLEEAVQEVVTVNPFDTKNPVIARLENRDLLPALNLTYSLSQRTNLRLAASRTVNRPEFRELSPFAFVELTGGRSVVGNPNLKRSLLDAVELRWESFPTSLEVMAASVFYKRIQNPIERIIQPTTELRSSWTNAQQATLKGVELEYRRSLAVLHGSLRNFFGNFNYAYVDSQVTVPRQALSVVTSTTRPLEGQAKHVFNAILEYHYPQWDTLARVLYNFTGRRLSEVGAYGLPDIYEDSSGTWDFLFKQSLRRLIPGLELTLSVTNLTNQRERYLQKNEVQRSVKSGRTLSFGLGYAWQ
ncbi:MAG: outer membrane beta-barrel protein [Thermoanaerobaculum sp.]|nr:outer membrane beta-barrel protein [Thermoanaerobaculum sp.]